MKPRILHWIWNLSLGGDAKNLCALAIMQQAWADVTVATRSADPGVRAEELKQQGITVIAGVDSPTRVEDVLNQYKAEIVIVHRNGRPDPIETSIIARFNVNCAVFEFNTFGVVDKSTDKFWMGHMFPSRTCLIQYAQRRGIFALNLSSHAAPGYALNIKPAFTPIVKERAKAELGIAPETFTIVRLVRPDLRKWDPLPVLAVQRLLKRGRQVHLIVMSPPPQRINWLKKLLGNAVTIIEPTSDPQTLDKVLAASDCIANYSHIGETFGLAMAEGMAAGLPPIVNSTPNMDNAQIEIVTHGRTGLVANSLSALVAAIELLLDEPDYAEILGTNAREYIAWTFSAEVVEPRVRNFMWSMLREKRHALRHAVQSVATEEDSYRLDTEAVAEISCRPDYEQRSEATPKELFNDDLELRMLALQDAIDYALSIGPQGLMAALTSRLKRGSLTRG